jgi:hypothetical protein
VCTYDINFNRIVSVCIYLLVCVKQPRVDVKREREREKRKMFNVWVCVWHRDVHWVACRQTLNDKKKKTDARREKGGLFYSHTKMKQKRERERKEKIGRKMQKEQE